MNILFPSEQIIDSEHFNVGQDWEVPIVGFFIIGAKDKTKRSVLDFDDESIRELAGLLKIVRAAMKEVLHIEDVYVFQNEDTEHGFHVWMFPRHDWMEKFGRKIESVRPIMLNAISERSMEPYLAEIIVATSKVRDYLHK